MNQSETIKTNTSKLRQARKTFASKSLNIGFRFTAVLDETMGRVLLPCNQRT